MPRCSLCQTTDGYVDWWVRCEHNPYFRAIETQVRKPITRLAEDGRLMLDGFETEVVREMKPNFVEEPIGERVGSGVMVAYKKAVRGFKEVEDFGYAPFCDARGCWAQSKNDGSELELVTIVFPFGHRATVRVHTELERKLAKADSFGKPIEQNLAHKREEQLERF